MQNYNKSVEWANIPVSLTENCKCLTGIWL